MRPFLKNVQALRFVAAAMVVIQHVTDQLTIHPLPGMTPYVDPTGIKWWDGADVFFVISGFIMYFLTHDRFGKKGYSKAFLKLRLMRVVPLYWVFTTVMLLVVWTSRDSVVHADTSPIYVASSYFFVPMGRLDGMVVPLLLPGWTINHELFFYAMFAVALLAPRAIALAGMVGFSLILVWLNPFLPAGALRFWSDPMLLEFIAGVGLGVLFVEGVRAPYLVSAAAILLAIVLFSVLPSALNGPPQALVGGAPAFLLAAGVILAKPVPVWRPAVIMGDASYSLYLCHPFVIAGTAILWRKLHLPASAPLFGAGMFVGALGISLIVYLGLERPLLGWMRRPAAANKLAFAPSKLAPQA